MKKLIARRRACRGLLGLPFASSVLTTTTLAWAVSGKALAATSIELSCESFNQLKQINAGKPWAIHLWGLSSAQALAQLPKWGEFVRRNSKARIVLVHFELQPAERVASALKHAGLAQVPILLARVSDTDRVRREFDRHWNGALPRTLLIDHAGRTASSREAIDFSHLRDWLMRNEPPPDGATTFTSDRTSNERKRPRTGSVVHLPLI